MGVGDGAGTKHVWRRKSGGGVDTLAPLRIRPCFGRAWISIRLTFVSEAKHSLARASTIPPPSVIRGCPANSTRQFFCCKRVLGLAIKLP